MDRKRKIGYAVIGAVLWLAIWQAAAIWIGRPLFLPSPAAALKSLLEMAVTKEFWRAVGFSLGNIAKGFLLGILLGTLFAGLSYCSDFLRSFFTLPMRIIKATPVASFTILALLWLKSEHLSILISFLMVLPILYTNVLTGLDTTDEGLLEMARVFRVRGWHRLRYIYFPSVWPQLFSACSVAVGLAWKSGIAAEVIGIAKNSIGNRLYQSKIYLEIPELFAWTFVTVAVSILSEQFVLFLLRVANRTALGGGMGKDGGMIKEGTLPADREEEGDSTAKKGIPPADGEEEDTAKEGIPPADREEDGDDTAKKGILPTDGEEDGNGTAKEGIPPADGEEDGTVKTGMLSADNEKEKDSIMEKKPMHLDSMRRKDGKHRETVQTEPSSVDDMRQRTGIEKQKIPTVPLLVTMTDVNKSYGDVQVLSGFSLTLQDGETAVLVGKSGIGKTTLLRLLLGLTRQDAGTVALAESARFSVVFQENRLCEGTSVRRNLELVCRTKEEKERILPLLGRLGLADCADRRVSELSGGMKRRVALARALLADYTVLLLDEPFSGLDAKTKWAVMALVKEQSVGKAVLLVTHAKEEMEFFLDNGKIIRL